MEGVNDVDVRSWSTNEVLLWLQSTNDGQFDEYVSIFEKHQIYGDALLSLTNDILRDEMKIMAYGARHALLKAIESLSICLSPCKKSIKKQSTTTKSSVCSNTYCFSNNDQLIDDNWENLNTMAKHGVVDASEYIKQAKLIVQAVTGTTIKLPITRKNSNDLNDLNDTNDRKFKSGFFQFEDKIPDWNKLTSLTAIKYEWNIIKLGWDKSKINVKIAPNPFSRGSLRVSYYCLEDKFNDDIKSNLISLSVPNDIVFGEYDETTSTTNDLVARLLGFENRYGGNLIVAKQSIDLTESVKTYFNDARTQSVAQLFANEYNKYNPPKKVAFIKASVIQLLESDNEQFFCVEDYLHGAYMKHLDNYGGDEGIRNTPSAFAHFTYEASQHKLLVCDLQGVADLYTDPQIHTFDGKGFGKGNLGLDGMIKFLKTHKCNAICQHLRLDKNNHQCKPIVYGTRPAKMYMDKKNIKFVEIDELNNDKYHNMIPQIYQKIKKENEEDEQEEPYMIDNNDIDDDDDAYNPLTPLMPNDVEDTNCRICNCILL